MAHMDIFDGHIWRIYFIYEVTGINYMTRDTMQTTLMKLTPMMTLTFSDCIGSIETLAMSAKKELLITIWQL